MTAQDERADLPTDLPPIKTEATQALRETIHGQGLSMLAMGKELREKDATISRLQQEREGLADQLAHQSIDLSNAISRANEAEQERDALLAQNHGQGHGDPCTMCGKPINSLAGNPGLWGGDKSVDALRAALSAYLDAAASALADVAAKEGE